MASVDRCLLHVKISCSWFDVMVSDKLLVFLCICLWRHSFTRLQSSQFIDVSLHVRWWRCMSMSSVLIQRYLYQLTDSSAASHCCAHLPLVVRFGVDLPVICQISLWTKCRCSLLYCDFSNASHFLTYILAPFAWTFYWISLTFAFIRLVRLDAGLALTSFHLID